MEDFAGRSFHTARWDYDYTGGGPRDPLTGLADKTVALVGTGASGIQCVPPLAESAKHLYVFQRTPSAIGERGNRPTDPDFAPGLVPGWQRARMDNFQAIMSGRPVEVDLVDDGWTHHYAAVQHPPRAQGMTTAEYLRSAEEIDYGVMDAHRRRVEELVADPATAEILKPYYRYLCKRPCFHDEYLSGIQQPQRHTDRLPCRDRADHRAGPGRRREAVRGRLHHLRDRLRGRAHPAVPTRRPRDRRTRRCHPGREVGRRCRQPVRDDEPWLPEHVRHAGAGAAGGGDRQLHAAGRARGRVRRRCRRAARAAGRGCVRRERRGRGSVDAEDRRLLRRRRAR